MQFPHLPPRLHILQVHTRHLAIRHHLVWTFSVLTLWTFSVLTLEFPPSLTSLQSPWQPLSAAWWPLSSLPIVTINKDVIITVITIISSSSPPTLRSWERRAAQVKPGSRLVILLNHPLSPLSHSQLSSRLSLLLLIMHIPLRRVVAPYAPQISLQELSFLAFCRLPVIFKYVGR